MRFDDFGLPEGDQQAWVDLCLRVEADTHAGGWGQSAALYGVLSPTATAAELGFEQVERWRTHLATPRNPRSGVLLDVVRAGSGPDPWQLLVGQRAPANVVAAILVWTSMGWPPVDGRVGAGPEPKRQVWLTTRGGAHATAARVGGQDTASAAHTSTQGPLTGALARVLDRPAPPCPHPVSSWLARLTIAEASAHLLALAGGTPAHRPRAPNPEGPVSLPGAPASGQAAPLAERARRAVLTAAVNVTAQLGLTPESALLQPWASAADLHTLCVATSLAGSRTWQEVRHDERCLLVLPEDVRNHSDWFDADLAAWAATCSYDPVANTLGEVSEKVGPAVADAAAATLGRIGWFDV